MSKGKVFLAGLIGAVAGAVGGLLFAPKSGKEMREDLVELLEGTNEKVKEVFGNASKAAIDKYQEIKGTVIDKLVAVKSVGKEIDKEKYASIVDGVVEEFKDDFTTTKNGALKMANQLKKDWEKVRKALVQGSKAD